MLMPLLLLLLLLLSLWLWLLFLFLLLLLPGGIIPGWSVVRSVGRSVSPVASWMREVVFGKDKSMLQRGLDRNTADVAPSTSKTTKKLSNYGHIDGPTDVVSYRIAPSRSKKQIFRRLRKFPSA